MESLESWVINWYPATALWYTLFCDEDAPPLCCELVALLGFLAVVL